MHKRCGRTENIPDLQKIHDDIIMMQKQNLPFDSDKGSGGKGRVSVCAKKRMPMNQDVEPRGQQSSANHQSMHDSVYHQTIHDYAKQIRSALCALE